MSMPLATSLRRHRGNDRDGEADRSALGPTAILRDDEEAAAGVLQRPHRDRQRRLCWAGSGLEARLVTGLRPTRCGRDAGTDDEGERGNNGERREQGPDSHETL